MGFPNAKLKLNIDYISADRLRAISSLGDRFLVGEEVGHQDTGAGTAFIEAFDLDTATDEILVHTTKGTAHLAFIKKL